jgi:hypothetical protein
MSIQPLKWLGLLFSGVGVPVRARVIEVTLGLGSRWIEGRTAPKTAVSERNRIYGRDAEELNSL